MPGHDLAETRRRLFSYQEASSILPEIQRITEAAFAKVQALAPSALADPDAQETIDRIVTEWTQAVVSRGAEVKGLWLVDFDNGFGYYCWSHPEPSLQYYHSYQDGFRGRVPIQ